MPVNLEHKHLNSNEYLCMRCLAVWLGWSPCQGDGCVTYEVSRWCEHGHRGPGWEDASRAEPKAASERELQLQDALDNLEAEAEPLASSSKKIIREVNARQPPLAGAQLLRQELVTL